MEGVDQPFDVCVRLADQLPKEAGTVHRHERLDVRFDPPLTRVPRTGRGFALAEGTCNGRPARYVAWNEGTVSCSEGAAAGGGSLVIRRRRLRFRLTETRVTGAATLRLEGVRGGSAVGTANISAQENPAEIAVKCAGPGLSRAAVDINISTTPSISG